MFQTYYQGLISSLSYKQLKKISFTMRKIVIILLNYNYIHNKIIKITN